jgi:hypothetical protein
VPYPTPKLEDHPLSFCPAAYSIYSQLSFKVVTVLLQKVILFFRDGVLVG